MELQIRDCRHITTNEGMFETLVEHLKFASAGEAIVATMSVFHPAAPTSFSSSALLMANMRSA